MGNTLLLHRLGLSLDPLQLLLLDPHDHNSSLASLAVRAHSLAL